jgi:hypothetical protein
MTQWNKCSEPLTKAEKKKVRLHSYLFASVTMDAQGHARFRRLPRLALGQVYNQGTQKACLTSKSANVSVSNESIL